VKIRNGFVSNSSSSSFVVIGSDYFNGKSKTSYITAKEKRILLKYGFKRVNCFYADQIDLDLTEQDQCKRKIYQKVDNYGYLITVNQDDVIYFLLKNNIPFEASCHYGHYTVIYQKGAKNFLMVQNFGTQASMSNWRSKNYKDLVSKTGRFTMLENKPITKINVKRWLRQEEKWMGQFERQEKNICAKQEKANKEGKNENS